MNRYGLYDLVLRSDRDPGLPEVDAGERPGEEWEVVWEAVDEPHRGLVHDVMDFDGIRRLRVWWPSEGEIILFYGDRRVRWLSGERLLEIEVDPDETDRLLLGVFLERVVAPIAMMLERPGFVALHASAMGDPDGGAWAILGHSGAGKSTAALHLLRQGWELLADDLVLVDTTTGEMLPVAPTIRLFDGPEVVKEALESRYVEAYRKYLHRFSWRGPWRRRPLKGLFYLEPGDPPNRCEEIEGWEAARRVLEQAFEITDGPEGFRARRFSALCGLTREVPVRVVRYEKDRDAEVPGQVEAILRVTS